MVISFDNYKEYGLVYDEGVKAYAYGAKQLNKYIEKSCGFKISKFDVQKRFISIGYNAKSKALIDGSDKSTLKRAGLRIVFSDSNIYVYGGSEIGTVYGVFEFCERYLGIKFLTSTDEAIPSLDKIELDELDVESNPCFEQRECAHFSYMVNPDYTLKRRYESGNTPDHDEAGIVTNTWYSKISNSHNSFCYVPKDKYYKTHPEIFSVPNPEKKHLYKSELDGEGLFLECCYSNGITDDGKVDDSLDVSAVKIVADSLYHYIKEDSNKKYFMFGRQDNEGAMCYCKKCVEKRKRYGGEAGTMIIFLNAVIELVEKRILSEGGSPDFNLVTFAYQSTFDAPVDENLKPIDELVIPNKRLHLRYAPHHKNSSYGVMDERQDEGVRNSIIGWSNLTPNVMVWDYPVHYMDNLFFVPTYLHLAEDIEYYSKIGVSYLMYEEAYSSTQAYNMVSCFMLVALTSVKANTVPQLPDGITLEIRNGAQIKTSDVANDNGMRFFISISNEDYLALESAYGEGNVEYGVMLCRTEDITSEEDFKIGSAVLSEYEEGLEAGTKFYQRKSVVPSLDAGDNNENGDDTDYAFYGSFVKIKDINFNRDFSARGYVAYKNGETLENIVYSDVVSRSIFDVATGALLGDYADDEYCQGVYSAVTDGYDTLSVETKVNDVAVTSVSMGDTVALSTKLYKEGTEEFIEIEAQYNVTTLNKDNNDGTYTVKTLKGMTFDVRTPSGDLEGQTLSANANQVYTASIDDLGTVFNTTEGNANNHNNVTIDGVL